MPPKFYLRRDNSLSDNLARSVVCLRKISPSPKAIRDHNVFQNHFRNPSQVTMQFRLRLGTFKLNSFIRYILVLRDSIDKVYLNSKFHLTRNDQIHSLLQKEDAKVLSCILSGPDLCRFAVLGLTDFGNF